MSKRCWREIPRRPAISVLVLPVAGITSSRSNSPGCAGHRFGLRLAAYSATVRLLNGIVQDQPGKRHLSRIRSDTPRAIDMNRVAGWNESFQRVKVKPWKVHLFGRGCGIKPDQNPLVYLDVDLRG